MEMNSPKKFRKSHHRKKNSGPKKKTENKLLLDGKDLSSSDLSKLITNRYRTDPLEDRAGSVARKKSVHTIADQYFSTHIDHISNDLLARCVSNPELKDECNSSNYSTDDTDIEDMEENFLSPFSLKKPDIEKNYVLKICNQIRSFSFVDQNQMDEQSPQAYKPESVAPTTAEFPSEYFDKSSNDEFEYEYTEIIIDDFRKVLDRYDGSVSADNFIRKQLPSPDVLSNLTKPQNDKILDMYFILKRMMTKKKYVEATLRLEKESRKNKIKRNMNSSSSLKSRPSTALISANEPPETKEFRPRMVNLIPMKQANQIDNDDNYEVMDDELNERLDDANYYYYTDVPKSDYEFYYEPFKIDLQSSNQQWPFELDFDIERKKPQRGTKAKCNTCKKLPNIKTDDKSKLTKPVREKSNLSTETKYMGHTFNSASRCASAKHIDQMDSKKVVNKSIKVSVMNNYSDEFDIDKKSKEDEDYKDLKANTRVNKEEHMRKMNILPGKSFHSQRRKSISAEHVPVSQKKLESQKAKVLLTRQRADARLGEKNEDKNEAKNLESKSSISMESNATRKKQYLAMEHEEMFYSIPKSNGDYYKSPICYPFSKMEPKKNKKESSNQKGANRPKTSKV